MVTGTLDPHAKRREFVRRALFGMNASVDEAEDLCHDALLRFYSSGYAERDLPAAAERALLARVAFSCLIDSRRRRPWLSISDADQQISGTLGPEDEMAMEIDELMEAASLSPKEIHVLELRYGQGESLVTIAARLGLHVNSVRRRIDRALSRLRRSAQAGAHSALLERSSG